MSCSRLANITIFLSLGFILKVNGKIDCEPNDIRFFENSDFTHVDYHTDNKLTTKREIFFEKESFVIVGFVRHCTSFADKNIVYKFLSEDHENDIDLPSDEIESLFYFDEPFIISKIQVVVNHEVSPWTNNEDCLCDILSSINTTFIGCDYYYHDSSTDHDMSSSSQGSVTNSPSINKSSGSDSQVIIMIVVFPVSVMLLLNIAAFIALLFFVNKKKDTRRSRPSNATLMEVSNGSLYSISNSKENETKEPEELYTPVKESPLTANNSVNQIHHIRPAPYERPGTLPIIRVGPAGKRKTRDRIYSEVTPYHIHTPCKTRSASSIASEPTPSELQSKFYCLTENVEDENNNTSTSNEDPYMLGPMPGPMPDQSTNKKMKEDDDEQAI